MIKDNIEMVFIFILLLLLGGLALAFYVLPAGAAPPQAIAVQMPDKTAPPPDCPNSPEPETCYWQLSLRDDAYLIFEEGCEIDITVLADNALRIRCEVKE